MGKNSNNFSRHLILTNTCLSLEIIINVVKEKVGVTFKNGQYKAQIIENCVFAIVVSNHSKQKP